MTVQTTFHGEVAEIILNGKLLGGSATSDGFRDTVQQLLEGGTKHFVLNLADVHRVNSSGLGLLISIHTSIKQNSGKLALAETNESMEGIMVMTKLDSIFTTYSSVEEAVAALA